MNMATTGNFKFKKGDVVICNPQLVHMKNFMGKVGVVSDTNPEWNKERPYNLNIDGKDSGRCWKEDELSFFSLQEDSDGNYW